MKRRSAVVLPAVLGISAFAAIKNKKTPKNIGLKNGALKELCIIPRGISSSTEKMNYKVEPFPYIGIKEDSKRKLIELMKKHGKCEILINNDTYVYAVFTDRFGFNDDVELFFNDIEKKVYFKSEARTIDLGRNRKRYEKIRLDYLR